MNIILPVTLAGATLTAEQAPRSPRASGPGIADQGTAASYRRFARAPAAWGSHTAAGAAHLPLVSRETRGLGPDIIAS
jgi:hypothetical protein